MRLARCLLRYRGVAIPAIIINQFSIFFNFHIPFNLPSLIFSSFSSYSYPSTPTLNKHPLLTYYSHTTITYSHHPPPVTTNLLSSFLFPSPNSLVKPLIIIKMFHLTANDIMEEHQLICQSTTVMKERRANSVERNQHESIKAKPITHSTTACSPNSTNPKINKMKSGN